MENLQVLALVISGLCLYVAYYSIARKAKHYSGSKLGKRPQKNIVYNKNNIAYYN